jgi:hypothetical protein
MKRHTIFLGAVFLGCASVLSYAQAPVSFISQPLVPDTMAPGGLNFTHSRRTNNFDLQRT